MKYLLLLLRLVLFLAALGGLLYIYLWTNEPVRLFTRLLFWLLLFSTSFGLWVQLRMMRRK